MPCIPAPVIPKPTLPSGITIPVPSLGSLPDIPAFCCTLSPVSTPKAPIALNALVINPAILEAMAKAVDGVLAYLDSLPLECPREA